MAFSCSLRQILQSALDQLGSDHPFDILPQLHPQGPQIAQNQNPVAPCKVATNGIIGRLKYERESINGQISRQILQRNILGQSKQTDGLIIN